MKIYSIYKATNRVNGKSYIGFDSNWPERQYEHSKCYGKSHFHNAIQKYGIDMFDWEVICQSKDGEYLLNVMESYFIEYYDTFNNGYNMTKGGEGRLGFLHTEEIKKKIAMSVKKTWKPRKTTKGQSLSLETREKLRQYNLGRKDSIETKEKKSQSAFKGWEKRRANQLPIMGYSD